MRWSGTRLRKGDCSSLHGHALAQSSVKDGVAGGVGEVGEDDGVFVGEALAWGMRTIMRTGRRLRARRAGQRPGHTCRAWARLWTGEGARPHAVRPYTVCGDGVG